MTFAANVHYGPGCWEWMGGKDSDGYGMLRNPADMTKKISAHRLAYETAFGVIPAGLIVCHRCDNPSCVRPEHLFLGTHLENMRDKYAKGRQNIKTGSEHYNGTKTHCIHGHEFNAENTYTSPAGKRTCKECRRRIDSNRR